MRFFINLSLRNWGDLQRTNVWVLCIQAQERASYLRHGFLGVARVYSEADQVEDRCVCEKRVTKYSSTTGRREKGSSQRSSQKPNQCFCIDYSPGLTSVYCRLILMEKISCNTENVILCSGHSLQHDIAGASILRSLSFIECTAFFLWFDQSARQKCGPGAVPKFFSPAGTGGGAAPIPGPFGDGSTTHRGLDQSQGRSNPPCLKMVSWIPDCLFMTYPARKSQCLGEKLGGVWPKLPTFCGG